MAKPPAEISRRLRAVVGRALHPEFFFVNVGANDGISNDPIYPFLCEHGWRGIAVEPLEDLFAELARNYRRFPGVILERAAISPDVRPLYYIAAAGTYERAWTKQVGSLDRDVLLQTIDRMRTYQFDGVVPPDLEQRIARVDVPCLTFDQLMEKHRAARADFINVDAEGLDYEIVRSIDLPRWRPQILCIETAAMAPAHRDDLERRFAAHGYVFLEPFDVFSSVWVRRAIAPGPVSRMLRGVRAGVRAALGR